MQMMQEWLGQHKLDRKALAALASNAQAVQAYEDYLHSQVQDVMDDLLAEFDEPAPAQGTHTIGCICPGQKGLTAATGIQCQHKCEMVWDGLLVGSLCC